MARPAWLQTKAQRKAQRELYTLEDYETALGLEYEAAVSDMFRWSLPDELAGVPEWFPEHALFRTGTLGISPAPDGGYALLPGGQIRRTIYGTALTWIPEICGNSPTPLRGWRNLRTEEWPLLELDCIPAEAALPYIKMEASAMVSAGQNTIAMRQPVAVRGQAGTVGLSYVRDTLGKGDSYLPLISDGDGIARELEVVDLKASNWLDPLSGFIDWCDAAAAAALGLDAPSSQKASGMTTQEATAMNGRILSRRRAGLEQRRAWCDEVWDKTGIGISVEISEDYMAHDHTMEDAAGSGNGDTLGGPGAEDAGENAQNAESNGGKEDGNR